MHDFVMPVGAIHVETEANQNGQRQPGAAVPDSHARDIKPE